MSTYLSMIKYKSASAQKKKLPKKPWIEATNRGKYTQDTSGNILSSKKHKFQYETLDKI